MPLKLSPRRQKFVKEYLIDFNSTQAAIRAGYSPKDADVQGPRLLGSVGVKDAVAREQARLAARVDVKQEEVVRELRLLAFSNMADFTREDGDKYVLDMSRCDRSHMAAVQELTEDTTGGSGDGERKLVVRTKIKLSNKTDALQLLARHLGMLHDKTEVSGKLDLSGASDDELKGELARLNGKLGTS